MPNEGLERDNLFQLNLVIWANFPQPPGSPVTPVLRNAGFDLFALEQPMKAGVAELARLANAPVPIAQNPVPDAVLRHRDGGYTLLECKPSSFGADSERAFQARGLVLAGANVAGRITTESGATAETCYLVPSMDAAAMDQTLIALANDLNRSGFATCATGSMGVSVRDDGAYLTCPPSLTGAAQAPLAVNPEKQVVKSQLGDDPRPLYVIPWIPDADSSNLDALREKIRAELLARLGKATIGSSETIQFDDLLDAVTRDVFRYWRDRDSLRGRVFPVVAGLLGALVRGDARATVGQSYVIIRIDRTEDRDDLMEKVRTASVSEALPEGVQLPMEDQP